MELRWKRKARRRYATEKNGYEVHRYGMAENGRKAQSQGKARNGNAGEVHTIDSIRYGKD